MREFEWSTHSNLRLLPPSRIGLLEHAKRACYQAGNSGVGSSSMDNMHVVAVTVGLEARQWTICTVVAVTVGLEDRQWTICTVVAVTVGLDARQWTICTVVAVTVGLEARQWTICTVVADSRRTSRW